MRKPVTNRVLLVGWAAADWQLLCPLLDQGVMPKLSSLIDMGVSGNLAPVQPFVGPMSWTSLATGKRADKHGICSMLEPLPGDSGYQPVSITGRKCQAIWNVLSAAELKSHIIGWPVTSPAEPINGTVVSDRFFLHQDAGNLHEQGVFARNLCHPQALVDDLIPLLIKPQDLNAETLAEFGVEPVQASRGPSQDIDSLANFFAQASSIHAVACQQLSSEPWDFAAVCYPTLASWDSGLQTPSLFSNNEIECGPHSRSSLDHKSAWKFQDDLLSSLLELSGEGTTVILVSLHSLTHSPAGLGNAPTTSIGAGPRFGIGCLTGPGVRCGEVLRGATVLDVVPTVLSFFGLPLGEDMDGRPWLDAASEEIGIRYTSTWELIATSTESSTESPRPPFSNAAPPTAAEPNSEDKQMVRLIRRNQKINLALALLDSDRAELAIVHWKELMADFPEDPYFPLQLISSLINTRDYLDCRSVIDQLKPEMAEHPQVRLAWAEVESNDGHTDEARRIVRDLIADDLAIPEWFNRAGSILLKCKAWEEAERTFLKSLQMQADNPAARNGLSTAYWEQDRYEDAIRESRLTLQSVPSFSQARFTLAKCLQDIGKNQEAIDAFEICLSAGYQPQETHGRLAALYRIRDPIRANHHQLQSGVC